jgi:hypothetical protein
MKPGLTVAGVLGTGTALVFGAAFLVSALFPNGTRVASTWNGGMVWAKDGMVVNEIGVAQPAPMPVPMPIVVDDNAGGMEPAPDMLPTK